MCAGETGNVWSGNNSVEKKPGHKATGSSERGGVKVLKGKNGVARGEMSSVRGRSKGGK